MDIRVKSNGNVEIRRAYQGLTIVTNEDKRLNVILRDFGWEMNIEEPSSKDEKVIWHKVNNDDDFKPIVKRELNLDHAVNGGIPNVHPDGAQLVSV